MSKLFDKETLEAIRNLGLKPGKWEKLDARTVDYQPTIIKEQKENLEKLKEIIEMQIERDRKMVTDLRAAVEKKKHGGTIKS